MGILEIVLLAVGAVVVVVSFLIPAGKERPSEKEKELARTEIRELLAAEMGQVRSQLDDDVEESLERVMNKTERSLERLSNEKIMAVNEYSDTVLAEINKNHQEVMFLYDMLNDKHRSLKNAASEADKKVREVRAASKEASAASKEASDAAKEAAMVIPAFRALKEDILPIARAHLNRVEQSSTVQKTVKKSTTKPAASAAPIENRKAKEPGEESTPVTRTGAPVKAAVTAVPTRRQTSVSEPGAEGHADRFPGNNEMILTLHRQGRAVVDIARELDLGVGEVKLVIDLYRGME